VDLVAFGKDEGRSVHDKTQALHYQTFQMEMKRGAIDMRYAISFICHTTVALLFQKYVQAQGIPDSARLVHIQKL
jgi:hypothetical protein